MLRRQSSLTDIIVLEDLVLIFYSRSSVSIVTTSHLKARSDSATSIYFSFFVAQPRKSGLGSFIVELSRSHTIRHKHTHGRTPLNE